jgi:aldose 1-epimerase
MRSALLALALSLAANAANYSARQTVVDSVEVVVLTDTARGTEVTIVPSVGNVAFEMKVHGNNVLWTPSPSLKDFKAKPTLAGIPFLAPWANRLDQFAFYANGKKYDFNPDLGNVRGKIPIHGFLVSSSAWKVVSVKANSGGAEVTSRLEFWKYPAYMAQFPFAHTIEMTYRLKEGVLEVQTALRNLSTEPMPVSIGFHPYFRVFDAPRDRWKLHLPAKEQMVLSSLLLPTGERKALAFPDPIPLEGLQFDDVFTSLVRGADGRAEFWFQGEKQKVSVIFGPKYTVGVVYAPKGREYIAIEPMAALTNGMNMAQAGTYKELQSIPPGGEWRESFWVRPAGF